MRPTHPPKVSTCVGGTTGRRTHGSPHLEVILEEAVCVARQQQARLAVARLERVELDCTEERNEHPCGGEGAHVEPLGEHLHRVVVGRRVLALPLAHRAHRLQ
eukprot:6462735-Prymnesium_polylepis.1